jgi:hypothetical protein
MVARAASEMQTDPAAEPGVIRLPTGMGFEVDSDNDEDPDASTFVGRDSAASAVLAPMVVKDGEEASQITPPVLPPAPIVTPSPRRVSEPVMLAQPTPAGTSAAGPARAPTPAPIAAHVPTPAGTVRVESEPAPLLPPPMVAPTYPSAAPYTKEQHLAAGSAALKKDVVEARAFGEGSNVTSPGVHRGQTAEPGRRKLPLPLLIGGGAVAAIAVVVVIVLANGGGKSGGGEEAKSTRDHAGAKRVAAADKSAATESGSAMASETPDPDQTTASDPGGTKTPVGTKKRSGSDAATSETPGSGSDATVASNPPPPTQIPSPPPAVAKRPAATLGGKKVVLEYDTTTPKEPPKKVAVATPVDENAVKSARTAYFAGNKKLFAGDAEGAIKLYQQALGVYPGYVAGYRGLGLAYAQKGDKKNALKAFRTYLNAVPTAKDIALIKRRMTTLQR